MNGITSLHFWLFCLALTTLYYLVPARFRPHFLLAAGLGWYGWWNWRHLGLLLLLSAAVHFAALRLQEPDRPRRRPLFWATAAGVLAVLGFFKYHLFLFSTWNGLWQALFHRHAGLSWSVVLPLGLSFYLFRLLSYLIDVYRGTIPAEPRFSLLLLYVSFFPQMAAGPIDRAGRLLPQLRRPAAFAAENVLAGVRLILWGIFQKMVVADRLGMFVQEVFAAPQYRGMALLFGMYFYAFQIYCDFSGYSDIAIGLSRVLGFESAVNFDRPYLSRSVSEFWKRWHISLSSWLRDYLFLPLSYAIMRRIPGERLAGVRAESWGYGLAMSYTMLLCGVWHGAGWTFVVWGAWHGLYQVVGFVGKKRRKAWVKRLGLKARPRLHAALAVAATFHLVSLAWIFFRAPTLAAAHKYLRYFQFSFPLSALVHILGNVLLLGLFLTLESLLRRRTLQRGLARLPLPLQAAAYALFLCFLVLFAVDTGNEFIYFSF